MEASSSCSLKRDDETRALEGLLDIFGCAFDLREIAAAFCKAGRNYEVAAEILSEPKGCSLSAAPTHVTSDRPRAVDLSEQLSENISKAFADRNFPTSKPKKHSVSVGTVSSVLGKGYSNPRTLSNESCQAVKPMKVNLSEFQLNEVREEGALLDAATVKDPINNDLGEFLFKMLGDGFQLGADVIQDVLGSCGYDASKSIEKLVDLSASTLNRSDDIVGGFAGNSADKDPKQKYPFRKEASSNTDSFQRNETKPAGLNNGKYDLSREVLNSLFNADRPEELSRKTSLVRAVKKTRSYGTVVSEPLIDRVPKLLTDNVDDPPKETDEDVEEEDYYLVLRRNAKEHWVTMKAYYKAAIDAFVKGDQTRAVELFQQGHFFNNKAREADEKSSQKIFECSSSSDEKNEHEVSLDLRDYDVKDAIRLLKLHLTSLSALQDLKVIVGAESDNTKKGSTRRRSQVLKLLEREAIKWTDEDGVLTIFLTEIDPDKLSFAKKAE
ncbi:silencing defective [Thalictrum thalictroides]|uniref:Silencing defective n=1 Tax=Thalictrum thalictroides TaxID=46969 RepID=A0A7J6VXL9_THATH|nr:silencing defective [Thalictrum thalictroides]